MDNTEVFANNVMVYNFVVKFYPWARCSEINQLVGFFMGVWGPYPTSGEQLIIFLMTSMT